MGATEGENVERQSRSPNVEYRILPLQHRANRPKHRLPTQEGVLSNLDKGKTESEARAGALAEARLASQSHSLSIPEVCSA